MNAVPTVSLKMARVTLGQSLMDDDDFVVMGESLCGNRLVVYSRNPIRGLPAEYAGYGVDQVSIYAVRFTVEGHDEHERRKDDRGTSDRQERLRLSP